MSSDDETTGDLTAYVDGDGSDSLTENGVYPCLITLTGHDAGRVYRLGSYEMLIGRGEQSDIKIHEATVSRKHARLIKASDGVEIFDLRSSNGLTVNGERVQRQFLQDQDIIGLGSGFSLKFSYMSDSEYFYQSRLFDNASHDSLTKLYNKRYFLGVLERQLLSGRKRRNTTALLMLDLDYFKVINDTYGHVFGDDALRHVSALIRDESRGDDSIGRYGGEEFVMVLTNVDGDGAIRIAERVRQAVENAPLLHNGRVVPLTVSVGVALASEVEGGAGPLIALADERLYTAKKNGRNRVCFGCGDLKKEPTLPSLER